MFVLDRFPDARPRYPEKIAISAPLGFRSRVQKAADAKRLTVAAFLRESIELHLSCSEGSQAAGPASEAR